MGVERVYILHLQFHSYESQISYIVVLEFAKISHGRQSICSVLPVLVNRVTYRYIIFSLSMQFFGRWGSLKLWFARHTEARVPHVYDV